MGTDYTLYRSAGTKTTVEISEMSNRLQLELSTDNGIMYTEWLEPDVILRMLMEGIKVCSYWMSKEEFDEVFSKLETYAV